MFSNDTNTKRSSVFPFVHIIFMILLAVACFKVINGSVQSLTFSGFLQQLQSVPTVDTSGIRSISVAANDYSYIPFLGPIINFLAGAVSLIAYVSVGAIQIVILFAWFIGWMFV